MTDGPSVGQSDKSARAGRALLGGAARIDLPSRCERRTHLYQPGCSRQGDIESQGLLPMHPVKHRGSRRSSKCEPGSYFTHCAIGYGNFALYSTTSTLGDIASAASATGRSLPSMSIERRSIVCGAPSAVSSWRSTFATFSVVTRQLIIAKPQLARRQAPPESAQHSRDRHRSRRPSNPSAAGNAYCSRVHRRNRFLRMCRARGAADRRWPR